MWIPYLIKCYVRWISTTLKLHFVIHIFCTIFLDNTSHWTLKSTSKSVHLPNIRRKLSHTLNLHFNEKTHCFPATLYLSRHLRAQPPKNHLPLCQQCQTNFVKMLHQPIQSFRSIYLLFKKKSFKKINVSLTRGNILSILHTTC